MTLLFNANNYFYYQLSLMQLATENNDVQLADFIESEFLVGQVKQNPVWFFLLLSG